MEGGEVAVDEEVKVEDGEAGGVGTEGLREGGVGLAEGGVEGEGVGVDCCWGWCGEAVEELYDGKARWEGSAKGEGCGCFC